MLNNLHKRHLRQTDYSIRWVTLAAASLFLISAFVLVPLTRSLASQNEALTQEVAALAQDAHRATLALTD